MEPLSQDLIATLREALLVLDNDFKIKIANRSFYRTFQVKENEVENRFLFDLGNGQWNVPQLQTALREIAEQGTVLEDFAVEHYFPHIGQKVMLLNARRVERAPDAQPLILLAIEDVTAQRQTAATLQHYLERLESSNRQLEDFAHIASHDLQEPLRAIQAFSSRLQTKHSHALDEQGLDYLNRIQRAADRMRLLISDLMTYSRVNTQREAFESVSLTPLALECVADLTKRLEETGGRIEVGNLPTIKADPVQMRQLLQNLFDNGLKFHRPSVPPIVRIKSHTVPSAEFVIPTDRDANNGYYYLSVQDNGIGFEEKYKERIFLPFERLHGQGQFPGTGIGLAICHRIIERHGGSITAKSVPQEGTRFYIVLPRCQ